MNSSYEAIEIRPKIWNFSVIFGTYNKKPFVASGNEILFPRFLFTQDVSGKSLVTRTAAHLWVGKGGKQTRMFHAHAHSF